MDKERFDRLQDLFLQACELDNAPDRDWIEARCEGDACLAEELSEMLSHHARTHAALDAAALEHIDIQHAVGKPQKQLPEVDGYVLVREVDRGGQSIVYEAKQNSTGQRVALKVLLNQEFSSEEERSRQSREVEVLAKLSHPNIVGVIDRGRTDSGVDYVVMPYVDGRPLDKYMLFLSQSNGLSAESAEVLQLFLRIAKAVGVAHASGIVHRDLKPANIIVDDRGEPRILDFGLARFVRRSSSTRDTTVDHLTRDGSFLGSLPWASPEQAAGESDAVTPATDVYALGVILYQLLTGGRFPYEVVGNIRDVLENILTSQPVPPSSVNEPSQQKTHRFRQSRHRSPRARDGLNEAIDSIVLKALSKSPNARYPDADSFAEDVQRYLSGKPTSAIGEVNASAARRPKRRVAAAAIVLAGAVGLWAIVTLLPARPQATPAENNSGQSSPLKKARTAVSDSPPQNDNISLREASHQRLAIERGPLDDETLEAARLLSSTLERAGREADARRVWADVAAEFNRRLAASTDDPELWYLSAVSALGAGDADKYRKLCDKMLDSFSSTNDPAVAARVVYACLPSNVSSDALPGLTELAGLAVSAKKGNERILGAALYRAGRYEESISEFIAASEHRELMAWDYGFLAMAKHRLGQADGANADMENAVRLASECRWWNEEIEVQSIVGEAQELIRDATGAVASE